MDHGPLVSEEIDAGAELVRQFDHYAPVNSAFWLKRTDERLRYLYIASERFDGERRMAGYGEVLRLADQIRSPYLNPLRVKLIGADDPMARTAAGINEYYSRGVATQLRDELFGGVSAEDVYIYPKPLTVAAT